MIDTKTPHSPGWWLQRCSDKLTVTQKRVAPLYQRYEGDAPLPDSLQSAPDAAKVFWRTARTSFAEMLVKVVRYRLRIVDWVTPETDDTGDAAGVYARWAAAGGAAEQHDINRNVLIAGCGYSLTTMYKGEAAITAEDPRQVVTIHDPVRQADLRAAAKFFHDDDFDEDYAYLFLPSEDGLSCTRFVAKRSSARRGKVTPRFSGSGWEWDDTRGGAAGEHVASPMPIVRHRNEEGVGEFERHLDILNRIDHLVLQGMVIATLQAFKQRAIKVDAKDMPDTDPETGRDIDYNEVFTADPGALWKLPPTAEMWESGAVDVGPITIMATKALEQLSAVTFTPLSTFTPEAANQSATGASLVKEGQTAKVEDKQDRLSDSYSRQVVLLGHLGDDENLSRPGWARPRWAPAERYSLTEKAAASTGAATAGMPFPTLMRTVWQMDPQDIARMESERASEAFRQQITAQTVALATAAG